MKTVFFNIIIFLAIVGLIVLGVPTAYTLRDAYLEYKSRDSGKQEIHRLASLVNMKEHPWSFVHFEEFSALKTKYKDFEIWRREPFSGSTINIDTNGFRITPGQSPQGQESIAFFGGSTMWGYGVNDANTIPSRYADLTKSQVFNYGEVGYIARQSLNRLSTITASGSKPKVVVFYDGVNEVLHKCRKEHDFSSSAQDSVIRNRLGNSTALLSGKSDVFGFEHVVAPIVSIFRKIKSRQTASERLSFYDCDTNPDKAIAIAEAWYLDWLSAKSIVESNGGKFVGVLQPVSFIGTPYKTHLGADPMIHDEQLASQYTIIYKHFTKILRDRQFAYLDLSNSLNGNIAYYFDFCHLSPEGNSLIANKISKYISNRSD